MEIWEGLPEEVALLTGVLKGEFPRWMRRVRVFQAQHPQRSDTAQRVQGS